jgi:recombination protein RecT
MTNNPKDGSLGFPEPIETPPPVKVDPTSTGAPPPVTLSETAPTPPKTDTNLAIVVYKRDLKLPPGTQKLGKELLKANTQAIVKLIPPWAAISGRRFMNSAAMMLLRSPLIATTCPAFTIIRSISEAAELGMSFNNKLQQAFLVPISDHGKTECQMWLGYRGMIQLIFRACDVVSVSAEVVYEGDVFKRIGGTHPAITHEPNEGTPKTDDRITHAYSVATFKTGHQQFEIMTRAQLDEIKGRTRSSKNPRSPMNLWFSEWCRKTVIRRMFKFLPVSSDKADLIEKALTREDDAYGIEDVEGMNPAERAAAVRAQVMGDTKLEAGEEEPMDAEFTVEGDE